MAFPNRYTKLFFLDEATAMAVGQHRPCACCRRKDYTTFMAAIHASGPERSAWSAPQLDEALQAERLRGEDLVCGGHTSRKRLHTAELGSLPDGVMLALDEAAQDAWLLWEGGCIVGATAATSSMSLCPRLKQMCRCLHRRPWSLP